MTQINDVDRDNFLERIKDGLFTFIQIEIIFTRVKAGIFGQPVNSDRTR